MPSEHGKTKKTHRYNFRRLLLFVVVGVFIYVAVFMINHQGDVAAQARRQAELLQTQAELEQQVQYYSNELDYIGTDEYVEQEARNRFGWLKNGEIKYMEGNASGGASDEPSRSATGSASGEISSSNPSADPASGGIPASDPSSDSSSAPGAQPSD